MREEDGVAADWRVERIAELEAESARKDVELAARDVRIAELEGHVATLTSQVAVLTKQVAELMEKLGRNSRNSHLPPSSDGPGRRGPSGEGKGKPGARKRGGQPGHGGSSRALLPPDEVDNIVDLFPSHCDGCAGELPAVQDREPHRYQQVEVPPIKPHTTEWRCHEVACPKCRHKTRAPYDPETIPASPFGPRLMALIAFLTGVYHVSRRKTVVLLWELLGVRMSLGALSAIEARVSDAIAPAVEDAWTRVGAGAVKHTDGTSWLQAGAARALDHRHEGGDGVQDPRRQQQGDARTALWLASRDPRERSGEGAQLLGDGSAPDLLGPFTQEVRLVLRTRRSRSGDRPRAARLHGDPLRVLA